MEQRRTTMRSLVLSSSAILLATTAFAQMPAPPLPGSPPLASQQSMTIGGTVTRFTLTPRGDLDGLILGDGTQVHVPPHLSAELAAAVKPGDAVTVSGSRSPTGALFIAASVADIASNQTVTDRGPPAPGLMPPSPPPGVPSGARRPEHDGAGPRAAAAARSSRRCGRRALGRRHRPAHASAHCLPIRDAAGPRSDRCCTGMGPEHGLRPRHRRAIGRSILGATAGALFAAAGSVSGPGPCFVATLIGSYRATVRSRRSQALAERGLRSVDTDRRCRCYLGDRRIGHGRSHHPSVALA